MTIANRFKVNIWDGSPPIIVWHSKAILKAIVRFGSQIGRLKLMQMEKASEGDNRINKAQNHLAKGNHTTGPEKVQVISNQVGHHIEGLQQQELQEMAHSSMSIRLPKPQGLCHIQFFKRKATTKETDRSGYRRHQVSLKILPEQTIDKSGVKSHSMPR